MDIPALAATGPTGKVRALAHRRAAFRLAGRRLRQLAGGAPRRRRMAAAGRGPGPAARSAGAAEAQLRALAGFGFEADGATWRQSGRGDAYRAALDRLLADGLAFECHCSRSELAGEGGIHRKCIAGARRPDPAIRLRVADGCEIAFEDAVHGRIVQRVDREVGDFVLRRADGFWAYQLAVVVDDAAQGITDVVRGADLLDSTRARSCCSARSACRRRVTCTCRWWSTARAASCRNRWPRCRSMPAIRCPHCARPGPCSDRRHRRWTASPGATPCSRPRPPRSIRRASARTGRGIRRVATWAPRNAD